MQDETHWSRWGHENVLQFAREVRQDGRRIGQEEGYLRFLYSRIQTNIEEIAFYSGEKVEASLINVSYAQLKKQLDHVYFHKFWYIIVEQFLLKYVWSAGKS